MNIYAIFARQLRLKRMQAGLTIEELADAAGISVSFLAYLETNKKKPSLATIAKIAAALNVPVSQLLNEKTAPRVPYENQRILDIILKLLRDQSPQNTETVLATIAVLAKKLRGKQTR